MAWSDNVAGSVGSGLSNPAGAAQHTGGDISTGVKSWGKGFSDLNPFKKASIPGLPDVVAPESVAAPVSPLGSTASPAAQIAAPGSFTGGKIAVPGAPSIQTGDSAFRQNQLALANQLAGQAAGTGPSVAANQLAAGQEANIAATLAAANSARGAAAPAVQRAAIQQAAEIQGRAAQEAATARLQEQMQAAGLLGQVAGQGREMDIGQAQMQNAANLDIFKGQLQAAIAQGQMDQSTAEAMYNAQLQTNLQQAQINQQNQQMFNQLQAQYAAMGLDAATANQQAALQIQQLQQSGALSRAGLAQQETASQRQLIGGLLGAGGQVGAAAAMGPAAAASDVAVKEDIQDGDSKIRVFLDNLGTHDYRYTDPKYGEGRFVSPMAQELLKTDVGKSMVFEDDDGVLNVDYGRGFGALLAAQASLNKRLAKLEQRKAS